MNSVAEEQDKNRKSKTNSLGAIAAIGLILLIVGGLILVAGSIVAGSLFVPVRSTTGSNGNAFEERVDEPLNSFNQVKVARPDRRDLFC